LTLVSSVKAAGEYLLIKCFDYEMTLCLKVGANNKWDGLDLPRSTALKGDMLGFLILEQ